PDRTHSHAPDLSLTRYPPGTRGPGETTHRDHRGVSRGSVRRGRDAPLPDPPDLRRVRRDEVYDPDEARQLAHPLSGPETWAPLLDRIADAKLVLLGEASHGTHE